MIHRCETCPFWRQNDYQLANNHFGACTKADNLDSQTDLLEKREAKILGNADEDGDFVVTRSDFGCTLHPMNKAIL